MIFVFLTAIVDQNTNTYKYVEILCTLYSVVKYTVHNQFKFSAKRLTHKGFLIRHLTIKVLYSSLLLFYKTIVYVNPLRDVDGKTLNYHIQSIKLYSFDVKTDVKKF